MPLFSRFPGSLHGYTAPGFGMGDKGKLWNHGEILSELLWSQSCSANMNKSRAGRERAPSESVTACSIMEAPEVWQFSTGYPEADSIPRGALGSANQTPQRQNLLPDFAFKSAANLLVCTGFIWKIHVKQHTLNSYGICVRVSGEMDPGQKQRQIPLTVLLWHRIQIPPVKGVKKTDWAEEHNFLKKKDKSDMSYA